MRIVVEHMINPYGHLAVTTPDKKGCLRAVRWEFAVWAEHGGNRVHVRLQRYSEMERKSHRHKFRTVRQWDAYDERAYNSDIKRAEVPVPIHVQREAVSMIKIEVVPMDGMDLFEKGLVA